MLAVVNILWNVVYIVRNITVWPNPAAHFSRIFHRCTCSLPHIEALPVSLPPHRIRSYAMWILVIVENENFGNVSGLQWHNFHTKRNENRTTALFVLTAA